MCIYGQCAHVILISDRVKFASTKIQNHLPIGIRHEPLIGSNRNYMEKKMIGKLIWVLIRHVYTQKYIDKTSFN